MKIRNFLFFAVLISSILWGTLYQEMLRYPAYLWLSALFIITNFKMKKSSHFLVSVAITLVYTVFVSQYYSSFLYCLVITLFVYLLASSADVISKFSNDVSRLLKTISLAISINSFVLVIQYIFKSANPVVGLFPEPSHIGYTFGPLFAVLLFSKFTRSSALINLSITALLSPSSTLFFSLIVTIAIWLVRNKNKLVIFFVIVFMISSASAVLYISDTNDWAISEIKSGSMQVWLYGYIRAIDVMTNISIFGVGPFGWIPAYGEDDSSSLAIELMNQRDLASMLPFGLASFGIFFPAVILYIIYLAISFDKTNPQDVLFSIVVLGYLVSASFRWAGPTLSPLLIFGSILIAIRWGLRRNILKFWPQVRFAILKYK